MKQLAAISMFFACAGAMAADRADAVEREDFAAWFAAWPDRLYDSEDPEQLLVGALLSQNPTPQPIHATENFFLKALARDPANTLILYDAAAFCLQASAPALCDQPLLGKLVLEADNGAVWTLRALESERRGDLPAALSYLRLAATSSDFDEFFMRHMTLFDQALRAWRTQSTADRFVQTIGFAAGISSRTVDIVTACRAHAAADPEWRHECLRLGTAMERHGRTELTAAIGQALQIALLESERDTGQLARVKARQEARRADQSDHITDAWDTLATNDGFWNEYLTVFISEGEEAARTMARRLIDGKSSAIKQ